MIQDKETYKDKLIYYSLGNFVFDQYFSEEVRNGWLLEIEIDREGNIKDTKEMNVKLETNGQTDIIKGNQ